MRLILECTDPKAAACLRGKHVFASTDCHEHAVGLVLTYDPDKGLDLSCAITMLRDMVSSLRRAAIVEAQKHES